VEKNLILSARHCVPVWSHFRLLEEERQDSVWTIQEIPIEEVGEGT
jgi:hypothetical protein